MNQTAKLDLWQSEVTCCGDSANCSKVAAQQAAVRMPATVGAARAADHTP